jgi:Rrf2 family protein
MLRLSKKADYALIAMKHLASHPAAGTASAREIAEEYGVPPELLAKVLQRLVRGGLLVSHQGIRGGYALGRPASQISVADVIHAIDGPMTITACSEGDDRCEQYARCSVRDPLWRLKDRIVGALATFMISELAAGGTAGVPVAVTRAPSRDGRRAPGQEQPS